MKLNILLQGLEYELLQGSIDTEVISLENDSRKVKEHALYFCIKGANVDGHTFIPNVIEQGVSVIILEDVPPEVMIPEHIAVVRFQNTRQAMGLVSAAFYDYPSKKLTVIGITGTKGKTTTTYMIQGMLEAAGHRTGLIGTIEMLIGEERIPATHTTPESIVVQKVLADMVNAGLDTVVMEVSSQGLMLDRVCSIDFDYGIFTNLSEDHIGPNEHKSFDEYLMWKSKLFTFCKKGIFNMDDIYFEKVLNGHTCEVLTYGMNEKADYVARELSLYTEKGHLGIRYFLDGIETADVTVNLPGKFSVYNSLSAIAVARQMGVSMEKILDILMNIQVKGRVEPISISDAFTVIIDYAHNANSLESILSTLKEYSPGRLVCLFGCGGRRSKDRRFEMGEISGKLADLTIITSDNPRNEEPKAIMDDIRVGMEKTKGEYVEIENRKEAIRYAIMNAQEGDVIVLAGKGHEDYQEINGVKHHMDERELIYEILKEENTEDICGYHGKYFS